ncbi:MAG: HigA family addiction module antidote protein [Rhodocyclales bacterium]|nr:HigA family addiction module antidote protein [Rhodocyclales bacterium]
MLHPPATSNVPALFWRRTDQSGRRWSRRAVTPDTALRLARYFNTTAQFWLNLQSAFDLKQVEREEGKKIAEDVRPMVRAA